MKRHKIYAVLSLVLVTGLVSVLHFGGLDYLLNISQVEAQSNPQFFTPGQALFSTQTDPKSSTMKSDNPYALPAMVVNTNRDVVAPVLIDVNGDGLTDLVYGEIGGSGTTPWFKQAVLLNTGNGFAVGYKCYNNYENGVKYYYGTCANI